MKKILILTVMFLVFKADAQDFVKKYIERYKDVAIEEMNKTGIPASITLAQGMLESNWGRSELAVKANNHFGIKAGKDWNGKIFEWEDDEYHKGALIKSKFRVYDSPEESFRDHSEFLVRKERYRFLFGYSVADYKAWTKGLVKAGYATDPHYSKKLNTIIEKYGLWEYDMQYQPVNTVATAIDDEVDERQTNTITYINKIKVIVAKCGDTPQSISEKTGVSLKKILKYNKYIKKSKQKLDCGALVYLGKKKKKYYGPENTYFAQEGETLVDVSQKFGLNLSYLIRINKIRSRKVLKKGQRIKLKNIDLGDTGVAVNDKGEPEFLFDSALTPGAH